MSRSNGFDDTVQEWKAQMDSLEILLIDWQALRPHVLSGVSGMASVLLDAFALEEALVTSATGSQLKVEPPQSGVQLANFPEFISFPDPP